MDCKYLSCYLSSSLAKFISPFIQKRKKNIAVDCCLPERSDSETLGTLCVAFWVKTSKEAKEFVLLNVFYIVNHLSEASLKYAK